jgi:hypothetical protein
MVMKIFISGVMQGSKKGHGMQAQGYRQIIADAVKILHPNVEIFDPFTAFPDSGKYDDLRIKQTLFTAADEAASADVLIAYLPEASMGSALEMIRAYDSGKTIISISPMDNNWFIRTVSTKIFETLDGFCDFVQHNGLSENFRKD